MGAGETITLYHFTAAEFLLGIGHHGLTVGDVPTDLHKWKGIVGVWFTTSREPEGHGLISRLDKKRYRLTVELPTSLPTLHRWVEWSSHFVKPATLAVLHNESAWRTWYIVLGIVKPDAIVACHDMNTGKSVDNWRQMWTPMSADLAARAAPARRQAWQRRLIKDCRKHAAMQAARNAAPSYPTSPGRLFQPGAPRP